MIDDRGEPAPGPWDPLLSCLPPAPARLVVSPGAEAGIPRFLVDHGYHFGAESSEQPAGAVLVPSSANQLAAELAALLHSAWPGVTAAVVLPADEELLSLPGAQLGRCSRATLETITDHGWRIESGLVTTAGRNLLGLRYDGYRLRGVAEADLEPLRGLFLAAFHKERSAEHWRWKYQHNPFGERRVTVISSPVGEVVGQYCAYPVPFVRTRDGKPERLIGHQVGDTMTAPAVRAVGRGPTSLLARAAQHFYATQCAGRVTFNYGFNTANIRRFSQRYVGAHHVMAVPYLELGADQRPAGRAGRLGRLAQALRGAPRYRIAALDFADPALDLLLAEAAPHYGLLVARVRRELGWRYGACPDVAYRGYAAWRHRRLAAWIVTCPGDGTLVLADALVSPGHGPALLPLLRAARSEAPAAAPVVAWCSERPGFLRRALIEIGFVPRPEPNDLAMVAVPFDLPFDLPLDPALAPDSIFRELYLTMGDSDLC